MATDLLRNAYLAGSAIGLCCGILGWFAVLRGQVFAGDALSHVAFVGAVAAGLAGVNVLLGLFALTLAGGLAMAALGRRAEAGDDVIGVVFAAMLGVGALLLTLLARSPAGADGLAAASALFGSIYALSTSAALIAAAVALAVTLAVAVVVRPLIMTSLDTELAALRGVPVRALGTGFLLALALITADGTQAVGALLVLGLLAAPAGAAHQLTASPMRGLVLSAALAVGAVWGGLAISYAVPRIPPSSAIVALAASAFGASTLWVRRGR